jgi:hypothetical protein
VKSCVLQGVVVGVRGGILRVGVLVVRARPATAACVASAAARPARRVTDRPVVAVCQTGCVSWLVLGLAQLHLIERLASLIMTERAGVPVFAVVRL